MAMVALILVSMGIGGAAVAAAYEAQGSERREQLVANYEQRADLARQRVDLTTKEHQTAEQRFAVGMSGATTVLEKASAVAQARAQLGIVNLHLEEIRITGREPRAELSAPRVSGRDFVGERLRIEVSVPERVLATERALARDVQVRVEIGVANPVDLEISRARVLEVELALETLRRKLDIRQQFLSGKVDVVETELRVLEAEAEQVTKTLAPKIKLAQQEVARLNERIEVGLAAPVDLAEATVRRLELETALGKAQLDLALIRRRLGLHRSGRS